MLYAHLSYPHPLFPATSVLSFSVFMCRRSSLLMVEGVGGWSNVMRPRESLALYIHEILHFLWVGLTSSQILSPWLEDVIDSGIGLSYRTASLCSLAAQYDNPIPQSTISPSQRLRIGLQALLSVPIMYVMVYKEWGGAFFWLIIQPSVFRDKNEEFFQTVNFFQLTV